MEEVYQKNCHLLQFVNGLQVCTPNNTKEKVALDLMEINALEQLEKCNISAQTMLQYKISILKFQQQTALILMPAF